jgi:hypothetical protein
MIDDYEELYEEIASNNFKPSFKDKMNKMMEAIEDDDIEDILLPIEQDGFDTVVEELKDMDYIDIHKLLVGLLSIGDYSNMKNVLNSVDMSKLV